MRGSLHLRLPLRSLIAAMLLLASRRATAQDAPPRDTVVPPLFTAVTPLDVTFTADLRRLRGDRDSNAPWRPATMSYTGPSGRVVVPVRARTRGIWRLKHCAFPPLRLNFPGKDAKHTLFAHLGRPKLVNYCRDDDTHEQYILQELQLYRAYQLLTPASYRVRLLRIAYVDSASHDTLATRFAILAEDPEALAKRLGGSAVKQKGATAADFDARALAIAYLFEFMIGNTDFSFNGLHNTQLVQLPTGDIMPIAYDFDWSGAVNASYATPNPQFGLTRVTDRRYRGYCAITNEAIGALPLFRERKDAIYALYRDEVGQRMRSDVVAATLRYLDEFYGMIGSPAAAKDYFLDGCVGPR